MLSCELMKASLLLATGFGLVPAIAIAVFVSTVTPPWLIPPAAAFALFLLLVSALVRLLGYAFGLFLRLAIWMVCTGIVVFAISAIVLEPNHSLLAWILILTAVLVLVSTPPPRRSHA